mmetsp:Transcript_318/g.445  ORF Transcript_318/g.445 Transcript_318/m.445 type:complete len:80 (-) Transcript_318:25-264(-)
MWKKQKSQKNSMWMKQIQIDIRGRKCKTSSQLCFSTCVLECMLAWALLACAKVCHGQASKLAASDRVHHCGLQLLDQHC